MDDQSKKVDLVFEGGGVRGIGLVGALSVFEKAGYQFVNIAGTSAGAIVATLLAAGYTADEIKQTIMDLDFHTFTDPPMFGHIPLLGPAIDEVFLQGLYKGDRLQALIRNLLAAKGVHTFGDLIHPEYATEEKYRFKVRVIASDISNRRELVLPQDITAYGMRPEELDVSLAVRMSLSIPFFFTPVRLQGNSIVDGGLLSDFPVDLFDSNGQPEWPTFGIRLLTTKNPGRAIPQISLPHMLHGLVDELLAIFWTAMEAPARHYLANDKFVRTTEVDTLGILSTDFNLSLEQKKALFDSGVQAASAFLDTWDFKQYKKEFRSGKPFPNYREKILEHV